MMNQAWYFSSWACTLVKMDIPPSLSQAPGEDNDLVRRLKRDGNNYHQLQMNRDGGYHLLQVAPLRHLIESTNLMSFIRTRVPQHGLFGSRVHVSNALPKLVSTMYGFTLLMVLTEALLNVDTLVPSRRCRNYP
jgi:hypothetical protein